MKSMYIFAVVARVCLRGRCVTLHCACLSTRQPVFSAESIPVLKLCSARVSEGKGCGEGRVCGSRRRRYVAEIMDQLGTKFCELRVRRADLHVHLHLPFSTVDKSF